MYRTVEKRANWERKEVKKRLKARDHNAVKVKAKSY
jgi:hypothetical protein